jgi:hypothetical protein
MVNESSSLEDMLRSQCRSLRGDSAEADALGSIETACVKAFKEDAIRAWNDYQASGLHVTHEEADAWLAKLEAGDDSEPPGCHG